MAADIIHLLSDHLANQIAAGEVIQRPASAVKELLENAIDASATDIRMVVKDAGKELIQVSDNGKGMSPTDARMSFERHATSKIKDIEDLFRIRTMGFRGEALASIAAVAQVELKSRQADAEMGSIILIEGTQVRKQEACAMVPGTVISVRNLFYNVPARRQFLKTNTTEFRHILEEFTRVALSHPEINFRLEHNGEEQYRLTAGTAKARIVQLLGNNLDKQLVPLDEKMEVLSLGGFIGKPQASSRNKGMQFFFMNNRFIRSPYLHHAVIQAYQGLIEKEMQPTYVIHLELDPKKVDVNVHPSKQEVKFDDDKLIYATLLASVRHTLARYNISPSLDFTLDAGITHLPSLGSPSEEKGLGSRNFLSHSFSQGKRAHAIDPADALSSWKNLYKLDAQRAAFHQQEAIAKAPFEGNASLDLQTSNSPDCLQVQGVYLVSSIKSGLMVLHIQRALERIHFERLLEKATGETLGQKLLYPIQYEVSAQDQPLLQDALAELRSLGIDISSLGAKSFVVNSLPAGIDVGNEQVLLDDLLEQLKHVSKEKIAVRKEALLTRIAKDIARYSLTNLQPEQRNAIIEELLSGASPEFTPDGKRILKILPYGDLAAYFG